MNDKWRLLDWNYICNQSPEIESAWQKANDYSEYGINFYDYINTEDLEILAHRWWNSLPIKQQCKLISERIEEIQNLLNKLLLANENFNR